MSQKTSASLITTDDGIQVPAVAPIVISASRSTDIPAFYSDWFFNRLSKGYSSWTNPFNGSKMYVSYAKTKFIVFWSKNPRPLIERLDYLKEKGIGCYIQYTLNDYEAEGFEKGVPPLSERIETFKTLVAKLGKGSVVWRFDPLILTDRISIDDLIAKIERIGDSIHGYTEKLVFSFADIASYRKVKTNLQKSGINYADWTPGQMMELAQKLVELNLAKCWGLTLATCGEAIDLPGIEHNHCIDDRLIARIGYKSPELMEYLGADVIHPSLPANLFDIFEPTPDAIPLPDGRYAVIRQNNRDKGQRAACGCMKSKDIGQYNTCPHLCEYCYANATKEAAVANWQRHKNNPYKDTITGD